MTRLFNASKTAEIFLENTLCGRVWEVRTFPTGISKEKRILKTQFHQFTCPMDFVEFIAYHKFK